MSDAPQPTVTVERGPESTVTVKAEVPAERVEAAADRAFKRLVQKANIPGFRPGKAPRALYERTYGATHLYEEAARDLVDEVYRKAVEDERLEPLDSPDVEISQLGPQLVLRFAAKVQVRPKVELGDYTAHGATVEPKPPTDEDVDKVIADMREQHAEIRPATRAAEQGDVVTVDVDATVEGKPLPPLGRNAHLEIGRDSVLPGLAEALLGASEGETRTFALTFPADYPDPELRGRAGGFTAKVLGVADKLVPGADDDFAKTVGFADLAALRRAIRAELAHAAFHEARDAAAEKALAHAVAVAQLDVPAVLVDDELDHMVADLKDRLARSGVGYEQFLLRARKTEAELREEWRDTARRRAASLLVLDEIARAEEVGVTSQELAAELSLLPTDQREDPALRSPRFLAALARQIRNRKVIDRLLGVDTPEMERQLLAQAGAETEARPRIHLPGESGARKIYLPGE